MRGDLHNMEADLAETPGDPTGEWLYDAEADITRGADRLLHAEAAMDDIDRKEGRA
jgi:hypothetical protein